MRREFDPWAQKIPWEGDGYPLQCSCLGSSMDRGAWWATLRSMALQRVKHD